MAKFKIGDRIKNVSSLNGRNYGKVGTVKYIYSDGGVDVVYDDGATGYSDSPNEAYKLTNSFFMDIKEKFLLAFKSEPNKSFRKARITNGDDFLTTEGQEIFLGWLLQKHGAEFKTEVVDELLKEEK